MAKDEDMKDTEMKDAENASVSKDLLPKDSAKNQDPITLVFLDLHSAIELIEKAVSTKESRFVARALKQSSGVRKRLSPSVLLPVVRQCFPEDHPSRKFLLDTLAKKDTTMTDSSEGIPPLPSKSANLPEVEAFIHLHVLMFLVDSKDYETAIECGSLLVQRLLSVNRRMMDPLSAKIWFFYVRPFELSNRLSEVRGTLLTAYRTATLHHNEPAQAMLITLLLRNYMHYNQYELADKLVSKAPFPDSASNYQHARYFYYLGRLKSVQLDYTEAYSCLMQAVRKAPQVTADAFRAEVYKLLSIVQLLMGEIPDRDIFYQPKLQRSLRPYLQITQAVRAGDLSLFKSCMEQNRKIYEADKTYTLIVRLRQNVIKTGLRNISLAYSSISLKDISAKLGLSDVRDAEFVVAKAISDGVIDAVINHEEACMISKENMDIYSTNDPQAAFHKRIQFCNKIHNDSVKAMRYPEDAHKGDMESAEERRERLAAELELAKELAEEDDSMF